jgi:hypothetical protein
MGFAFLLAAQPSFADSQPPPFAAGKPHEGQTLVQRDCIACHAQRYAGDHEQIYLRLDRRVRTPAQLMAQIQRCNTETRHQLFPRRGGARGRLPQSALLQVRMSAAGEGIAP